MKKQIGFIGLGRMGANIALNLAEHGWKVIAYNRSPEPAKKLSRKKNIYGAYSLEEFFSKLSGKKIIWLMIPAGKPVELTLQKLMPFLERGDSVVDGGNSYFEDSIRRAKILLKKGINFLDVGVSGGVGGARHGACMMIGGNKKIFREIETLFRDTCVKNGYGYIGKSGSGHFVKMVHNGIEYGMMGSLNEGFETLRKCSSKFGIDVKETAKVYAHGSIIEGKLMSWLWQAFQRKNYLDNISCDVPVGETEFEMKKLEKMSDMKILREAVKMRERSRGGKICGDLISAMRNEFGGHAVKRK